MRQAFRQDEAEQILVEAVRRTDEQALAAVVNPEVSREKLQAMADELGVLPETLDSVLREREPGALAAREAAQESATVASSSRQSFINQRRADFQSDLWSYLGVNAMFLGIWVVSGSHGEFWPKWWLLWWGLLLFFHGIENLPTRGTGFEKAFARWQRKGEIKALKRAKKSEACRTKSRGKIACRLNSGQANCVIRGRK